MLRSSLLFAVLSTLLIGSPVTGWSVPQPATAPLTTQRRTSLDLNERGADAVAAQQYEEAEKLFHQAVRADSGNVTAAFNLAGMYIMNNKPSAAISLLEEYSQREKTDAGLFSRLGEAYFANQQTKEATAAFERALSLKADYPGVAARLGALYSLANRLPDAERLFTQAVKQSPKDAQLLANLSGVKLARGQREEAITMAKRSLELKPTKEAYITLGSAYESSGAVKDALAAFRKAQSFGGKNVELDKKVTELTSAAG